MLLVLLSDSSCRNTWMHFEAGVSIGAGKKVLPVAIRGFSFEKLPFPLKNYQGRYARDLEGILLDLESASSATSSSVAKAAYLSELETAEARVTEKRVQVRACLPESEGCSTIYFEIENTGNTDVELLFLEVWIPKPLVTPNGSLPDYPPTITCRGEDSHTRVRLYAKDHPLGYTEALESVLTPSMGVRRLTQLPIKLTDNLEYRVMKQCSLRFHLHCRGLATDAEVVDVADIMQQRRSSDG